MSRGLQAVDTLAQAGTDRDHVAERRCYTAAQIIAKLQISPSHFFNQRRLGRLPFLEELKPRLGRSVRYRADLVDRYLAGRKVS